MTTFQINVEGRYEAFLYVFRDGAEPEVLPLERIITRKEAARMAIQLIPPEDCNKEEWRKWVTDRRAGKTTRSFPTIESVVTHAERYIETNYGEQHDTTVKYTYGLSQDNFAVLCDQRAIDALLLNGRTSLVNYIESTCREHPLKRIC